jgi:hypothetical protein
VDEAMLVSLLLHEKVAQGEPKEISSDESQIDLGTNISPVFVINPSDLKTPS